MGIAKKGKKETDTKLPKKGKKETDTNLPRKEDEDGKRVV